VSVFFPFKIDHYPDNFSVRRTNLFQISRTRVKRVYCISITPTAKDFLCTYTQHIPGMRLSRMYIVASARSASWHPSMVRADRDSRMVSLDRHIVVVIPRDSAPLLLRRQSAAHRCFRCSSSDNTTAFSSLFLQICIL